MNTVMTVLTKLKKKTAISFTINIYKNNIFSNREH